MSTKKEILEYFKDINYAYNDSTRYDTLERMLSEFEGEKMGNEERCVICGEIIPEGRQVCPICEKRQFPPDYIDRRNWDLTQGVDEIQLLKEKVEALTEIVHNPNFVLIVRCRDCEYNGGDCERCLNPNLPIVGDDATYLAIDPDWYCADGKRRKNR